MDFGLINDNEHVFEIVRKTENSVKLSNGQEGLEYLFHLKLHPDFQQPSNPQILRTITIPNFFPSNELLTKGWLPGRYLFEKNWTEMIVTLSTQNWDNKDFSNVVGDIKKFLRKSKMKHKEFVLEKIPQSVKDQLCNSYLCHLWNSIVTQRLESLGPKPQVGDLIETSDINSYTIKSEKYSIPKCPTYYTGKETGKSENILMPVPGSKLTLYPNNEIIRNIYRTVVPKFGTKWFYTRVSDFVMDINYRAVVCHPEELLYSRISEKEFSLQFKLPKSNSYINVLRTLKTCILLSTDNRTSATKPMRTANSAANGSVPIVVEKAAFSRSASVGMFPLGKNMEAACNIKTALTNNKKDSAEKSDVPVEKEQDPRNTREISSIPRAATEASYVKTIDSVAKGKSRIERKISSKEKRAASSEKYFECKIEANAARSLKRERKTEIVAEGNSGQACADMKRTLLTSTEKTYGLPKEIEVITLDSSDESEDEPVFKKRKITTCISDYSSSGSDTEPMSDDKPKSFTVTGSKSTSGAKFTVINNIKREKNVDQADRPIQTIGTPNFSCVEVEGGLKPLKEKVGNGQVGQIKREPTVELNLPRLQNNQSCDKQHKEAVVKQEPMMTVKTEVGCN